MSEIDKTLEARGKRYGDFKTHAEISQDLKNCVNEFIAWKELKPTHKEAIEMIFHKIARILNGDPEYRDNWHDIAGYATLAEKECENKNKDGDDA